MQVNQKLKLASSPTVSACLNSRKITKRNSAGSTPLVTLTFRTWDRMVDSAKLGSLLSSQCKWSKQTSKSQFPLKTRRCVLKYIMLSTFLERELHLKLLTINLSRGMEKRYSPKGPNLIQRKELKFKLLLRATLPMILSSASWPSTRQPTSK